MTADGTAHARERNLDHETARARLELLDQILACLELGPSVVELIAGARTEADAVRLLVLADAVPLTSDNAARYFLQRRIVSFVSDRRNELALERQGLADLLGDC